MIKFKAALGSIITAILLAIATIGIATPAAAQTKARTAYAPKAKPDIKEGVYKVDTNHTQVLWSVDHMGFSRLYGMVGGMTGTLKIDPYRYSDAKVQIDIPLSGLTVTSSGFGSHLQTGDLFNVAKYPTARFVSRTVTVRGRTAAILGDLTLRGVTKPVTLLARFYGAGTNPMSKAQTIGFSAKAKIKRSDFGLGYAVPAVSDTVDLEITTAFEKR